MNAHEAKALARQELARRGILYLSLSAKTVDFTDLARAVVVVVTIKGFGAWDQYDSLKAWAREKGFRLRWG